MFLSDSFFSETKMDAKGGNGGNNGLTNEMNNSKDASSDSLVSDSKSSSLNSKLGQDHVSLITILFFSRYK